MQLMWQYNQETSDQVAAIRSEIHLPDVYHSVCIRRGDKNTEHAYVPIETYVRTIESTCAPGIPLFATSDDYQCIVDLARTMPDRMFVSLTKPSADGYYHADFKQLHPQERRNRTARFFAQLECLWGAESFIGSRTTNVGLMVNAYRGGDNVIWVD